MVISFSFISLAHSLTVVRDLRGAEVLGAQTYTDKESFHRPFPFDFAQGH